MKRQAQCKTHKKYKKNQKLTVRRFYKIKTNKEFKHSAKNNAKNVS